MAIQKRHSTLSDSRSEAERAELEAMKKAMVQSLSTTSAEHPTQKETAKSPSISKIRTSQINTHYTVKEKRRIEDAIREIEDQGIKVSTETFVHNAVAWWFKTFGDSIPFEQFLEEWKQNFEK